MKVLFVFVLPSGGVNTLNRFRARALRSAGIEAHLLYFKPGSGSADLEPDIPVYYTEFPAEIAHILQVHAFDVVVMTSFYLHLQIFRNAGYTGPIIFENQGFGTPDEARQAMLVAQPFLNAYADALLYPVTEHIGQLFREIYPHKPQFAFPNVFDAASFGYVPSDANPDRPVLAWMGRLEHNKNWRDYLKIGAEAAKYVPNLYLWMFTDPSLASPGENEQLEQLTQQLGLHGRITQWHQIPNYRMADFLSRVGDSGGALIMTSKGEGGPYAAVEAISCRCAVVTTDSDGIRTAVVDELTGLYYPHGDIAAGASQVVRLIQQPALRQRLLHQGINRIRTELSMERYAWNFVTMLRGLGVPGC